MIVYTIPQKMSGTGNIHDISSNLYDRDIKFPAGAIYAVVLASYYGGRGYSTHRTEKAAIQASHNRGDYSHVIIDPRGNEYAIDFDQGLTLLD